MDIVMLWWFLSVVILGLLWSYVWDGLRSDRIPHYRSVYYGCLSNLGSLIQVGAFFVLFATTSAVWILVMSLLLLGTGWKALFDYRGYKARASGRAGAMRYEAYSLHGCLVVFV